MRLNSIPGAVLAMTLAIAGPGRADPAGVDAFIITGLDISDSVTAADTHAQRAALAAALCDPELLGLARRLGTRRIAVAVFAWNHNRYTILPWTLIGTPEEAAAVALTVTTAVPVNADPGGSAPSGRHFGRLTDLSRALDHAGALSAAAPGAADRTLVNVVGNGADNVGEPAAAARDRLLARGLTVNAVVFGGEPALSDYFRQQVIGGPGAFLLEGDGAATLAELMRRKLLGDLLAGLAGAAAP